MSADEHAARPAARSAARPLREAVAAAMPSPYAGLATRALAFAIDAAIINVVAWLTALVVGLCLSLLDLPQATLDAIAGFGALLALVWTGGYFVLFWSTTGQTPGSRALRIRVIDARTDAPPRPRRAILRFLLLPLSAIPLCLGFALILVDDRRRALHDMLAHTLVTDAATADDLNRPHDTGSPVARDSDHASHRPA